MRISGWSLFVLATLVGPLAPTASAAGPAERTVAIPNGSGGIGFDDLQYSSSLHRVLVPAGRTGALALVDPATLAVDTITGFSASAEPGGGRGEGITSVDEGEGLLFVTDRTAKRLDVVDPATKKILSSASLASGPDYVRWVAPTREVWVTQPGRDRIEIFRTGQARGAAPEHAAFIAVEGGPESLAVDPRRGRAYTHLWGGETLAIDVKTRAVAARWRNGCRGSRGIALDPARGFLFAGCAEGKAVVLDEGSGRILSSLSSGNGVDIIDYDPRLSHLYLPGSKSATMAILGVSAKGELSLLSTVPTAPGAHCVVSDRSGHAYVCAPRKGELIVVADRAP